MILKRPLSERDLVALADALADAPFFEKELF